MLPVFALVGRPNVGKSTLFNYLTRSKDALVFDRPGTTRDRQYGHGKIGPKPYLVIDTGGIGCETTTAEIEQLMSAQTWQGITEADVVLWLVDAQNGITDADLLIAKELRKLNKPIVLVVNKIDGLLVEAVVAEFYSLGISQVMPIAAHRGSGVRQLMTEVLLKFAVQVEDCAQQDHITDDTIKVSVIGQPNVGKSTLINNILGEERLVVCDTAGTTRDSIYIPFRRRSTDYTLIDTAGLRKRRKITDNLEKFSVVKTLQAVHNSQVVVFMIDASREILDQDLHLLDFVLTAGKSLIILFNKWDKLDKDERRRFNESIEYRLRFVKFAKMYRVSALRGGDSLDNLFRGILAAYRSAFKELPTAKITQVLKNLVIAHPPPLIRGRRIKLKYAHAGGKNPPRIIVHGNQTDKLADSYKRYLSNSFIKHFKLVGTPVWIECKNSENPY